MSLDPKLLDAFYRPDTGHVGPAYLFSSALGSGMTRGGSEYTDMVNCHYDLRKI